MKLPRLIPLGLLAGLCPRAISADAPPPAAMQKPMEAERMKKTFNLTLLPRAFQSKPMTSITVLTEVTEAGKRLLPPTPQAPAYYQLYVSGYHKEGGGQSQEASLSKESLQREVSKSLIEANYKETDSEHAPTLVLSLVWGEHNRIPREFDLTRSNLISRAVLVGGREFAEELAAAVEAQERELLASGQTGMEIESLDPIYLFTIRSDKNRSLMEQVYDDCYFVVVSAYDKAAYDRGEMVLYWRTKMTTAAQGVSLAETSTALAASGARYFGRWMTEPSIIDKKISRKTKVEMGETRTLSMDEPASGGTREPEKREKK